ncbi:hypothetical protein [Streptomyces coelicoflavus]
MTTQPTHPYTYTDAQDHRLTLRTAGDATNRPYVWIEAENLAIGGALTNVWLTVEETRQLLDALADGCAFECTDHTGDSLTVRPADDVTVFEVTRCADEPCALPAESVRVVVLTGRLGEVRAAFTATAEHAQQRFTPQAAGQPTTPRYWLAVDVPAADLDTDLPDALAYAADRVETVLQEERGYNASAWHATETHNAEQPTAPRVLTDAEEARAYLAARDALTANRVEAGGIAIETVIMAALATVGILTAPPMSDPDTCPAQFADPTGEWHQCTEAPDHDPAAGHEDGDWFWPDGQRYATPDPAEDDAVSMTTADMFTAAELHDMQQADEAADDARDDEAHE